MTAQQTLEKRQDLVQAFQNISKTSCPICSKIILKIMRLIETEINLTQASQIIIIDSKYILYIKKQAERMITRIGQINYTTTYVFVWFNNEVQKRIKYCYCKRVKMIKRTV